MLDGFGKRLKKARKNKKLTAAQLGKRVGIYAAALYEYENGHRFPSLQTLEWICAALDVSASELLGF